ncbi:MAG: tetraacyldisaccharide 4'-kinase [Desulfobulbaceae bacterium]|nr:tetraacyldisaccharide 4'-kinase [Desulfobulbaceae bacterium]
MKSREKLYHKGIIRQESLAVPVISIGNLVLGGTGKTPTVQHVAKLLSRHGYHPAVISRGYKGKAKETVNIVSDGENVLLSPALAGDEPYMLAKSLPKTPVLTGTRRLFSCRHSIEHFHTDVILLDDGFQHLNVKRDIDIVLFDSTALAGNSRVFPGGPLREPISALNRCQAFLLTGEDQDNRERTKKFSNLLQQQFSNKPVFISALKSCSMIEPNKLMNPLLSSNGTVPDEVVSRNFLGFCGIANPLRFKKSLSGIGIHLASFQVLKDHITYNQTLLSNLCKKAIECGADSLVTTEKDYVKLQSFNINLPIYVLQVHHEIEQAFDLFLLKSLQNLG